MIAILIPTLGRAERLAKIVREINNTTKECNIYFIVEEHDTPTIEAFDKLKASNVYLLFNEEPNTYVSAINSGFQNTTEEVVFCASDDLTFTEGWSDDLRIKADSFGFIGVKDSWTITKTGKHASHFAVRRDYIEEHGGAEGYPGYIYYPLYNHFMCDIESEQTAQKRGQFVVSDGVVEHNHWFMKTAEKDKTYSEAEPLLRKDMRVFNERRSQFEQYLFEDLFVGKITPVFKQVISIVIASYNAPSHLIATVNSFKENTHSKFEIVIIDDCSEPTTVRTISDLVKNDKRVRAVYLESKAYTNGVWNLAGKYAKHDIIVISNNDITVSKNWDVPILKEIADDTIVNPFQTDDQLRKPYGKHPRTGSLDIRGTLFAMNRQTYNAIFPIPKDLLMWFGDNYLADTVAHTKWVEESVVHHAGSKSSLELNKEQNVLNWIIRGDAYAYALLTGEDNKKWRDVIAKRLGLYSGIVR